MAQRVMDCGDAGHILVSKHVAEDLEQYEQWRPLLHDLGTCEVKHGYASALRTFTRSEVGNPQLPKKFKAVKKTSHPSALGGDGGALLVLAAIVGGIQCFPLSRPIDAVMHRKKASPFCRLKI